MDRREALKALAALPAIDAIKVANIKPDDVLVVECSEHLTVQAAEHIRYTLRQLFGEHQKVTVCDATIRLKVIKGQG